MAAETPQKLLQLWAQEELTTEQARPMGTRQLLQHVATLEARVQQLEQRLRMVEQKRQAQ